jgi:hypothetical protein
MGLPHPTLPRSVAYTPILSSAMPTISHVTDDLFRDVDMHWIGAQSKRGVNLYQRHEIAQPRPNAALARS